MLDLVLCEYELPLPEEVNSLEAPPEWDKLEFQTKSLLFPSFDDPMTATFYVESYNISDDGQLYKEDIVRDLIVDEKGDYVLDEKDNGIVRLDYTGELSFFTIHFEKEYDYYIEFKTLFWKGELKELDLVEWKKEENKVRLETQELFKLRVKQAIKKQNSKLNKVYKKIINSCFGLTKWVMYSILALIQRVERWMT